MCVLNEKAHLLKDFNDTKDKLTQISQQKARLEGELQGKGAQVSRVNELESEKATLKLELDDLRENYARMKARFGDKGSIEAKYTEIKGLLVDRESRLKGLTGEVNRLNEVILEKKAENEKLKGRAFRLDEIQVIYQKEREFRENEIKAREVER